MNAMLLMVDNACIHAWPYQELRRSCVFGSYLLTVTPATDGGDWYWEARHESSRNWKRKTDQTAASGLLAVRVTGGDV